jgi:hypothetical protein
MVEPASKSIPAHAIGTHSFRTAGVCPVVPANAVELSCSDLESVEAAPSPSPTSPRQLAGSEAPTAGGQTPARHAPIAATRRNSKRLILAAVIATLCAVVTVGAFAFARSNRHPSDNAPNARVAKTTPTATTVPASRPAHPALKKPSTANAQLASVRAVHPQPGQKPSTRGVSSSGTTKSKVKQTGAATKGKVKQTGAATKGKVKQTGAATKGKSHTSTHASVNGKTAAKTVG